MKKIITVLFLLIIVTIGRAQTNETRSSFFEQFIAELKSKSNSYKKILISQQPILWDTTGDIFHAFLSRPDTTNKEDVSIKHVPTRKKVIGLMKLVGDDDYRAFRNQIRNQTSDPFSLLVEIVGNKKSDEVLTISLSQPLVSADQKMVIIQEKHKSSSGAYSAITVYIREESKWVIWDTLTKSRGAVF